MSAAQGRWVFYLGRSANMSKIGILYSTQRQVDLQFNRPGSFTGTVAIDSAIAGLVKTRSTCVIAERNGVIKWSGAITSIVDDAAERTTQITATGWMEELDHRYIRQVDITNSLGAISTATLQTDTIIISLLIAAVNLQTDTNSVVRPTHVGFSGGDSATARNRTYNVGDNYGQSIRELSDIENGCDLVFDYANRGLIVRSNTGYVDQTDVHFQMRSDGVTNIQSVSRTDDGASLVNRVNAISAGNAVIAADDSVAIDSAGVMLEEWDSLSDVADATIVGAYANAELVFKRYGIVTYALTPLSQGVVPRLFDDFELGDKVYFSVNVGRFSVSRQAIRVFSATIAIDDLGNETISELGTSPSSG